MNDKDGDPTAEFLAEVRPEETPWRTERPPGEAAPERADRPEKWGRAKAAGRAAANAAPYVQAAALATWIVSGSLGDDFGDTGTQSDA
jgi:hypothetical protein